MTILTPSSEISELYFSNTQPAKFELHNLFIFCKRAKNVQNDSIKVFLRRGKNGPDHLSPCEQSELGGGKFN